MAGREGGGGVVGQSHSNSEEEQTATDGTTDTNGSGPTLNFYHVNCCFVSCFLLDYLLLILIFQLFLFYQLTLIFRFFLHINFCITIRLCFCIILFV